LAALTIVFIIESGGFLLPLLQKAILPGGEK